MLFLVLGYGSVLENFYPLVVQVIELLLLAILSLEKKVRLRGNYGLYLCVIYSCVVFSSIMTKTSVLQYASFIVRPIIALFILSAYRYEYGEIKYYLAKVLRYVTIHAVANFIVASFFASFFTVKSSSSSYEVHTLGYVFNYLVGAERFGITFTRNQGLFWEPGVLAIMMNIYLILLLFEYKVPIRKTLLPVFVILSTVSTTGYLMLAILLGLWYIRRLKESRGSLKNEFISFFSGLIVIAAFSPILIGEVKHKTTDGIGSTNKRAFDMFMGIKVALDNPLFGIGPDKDRYITVQNKHEVIVGVNNDITYEPRPNSNLFVMIFAYYGIPMGLLFLYGLFRQNVFREKRIYFLITIFALISEPVAFIDLYFLWIMSGSYKCNSNLKRNLLISEQRNLINSHVI